MQTVTVPLLSYRRKVGWDIFELLVTTATFLIPPLSFCPPTKHPTNKYVADASQIKPTFLRLSGMLSLKQKDTGRPGR